VVADLLRKRAIRKGRWFASNRHKRRAIGANYIRVAAICGLVGYVGLVLWGFVLAPPTLAGLKVDAPNALIAAVTGGFYVYHLDNVEMNTRPSRIWEVGPQALLTGVCGLIAASVSWEIIFGAAGSATDRILLTVIISATVGFVLAWYIPDAAAAAKADPLTEAREERIRTLEAAALERFGNAAAAAHWLDRPHGGLGNKSPKTAAANVETFEQAISLLQGPQAVVA
jgi:uncharacterized protein (DUF2384 family)